MQTAMPYSCEKACESSGSFGETQFIVITGGPGAGKTAVLEIMRKILCEHIAVLPEAASILFGGGFWRLNSTSGKMAAQRAIYHIQNETQNLVRDEHRWALGLCDRGTLDGLAYWPDTSESFCRDLGTSIPREFAKVLAVIHLASPSQTGGYNFQNPIRIESAEEARRIDLRIAEIWKSHPHYYHIESAADFTEKIRMSLECLNYFLPACCQKQLSGVKP